jgi:hypothetical protein
MKFSFLNSINRLFSLIVKQYVSCELRIEFINADINFVFLRIYLAVFVAVIQCYIKMSHHHFLHNLFCSQPLISDILHILTKLLKAKASESSCLLSISGHLRFLVDKVSLE